MQFAEAGKEEEESIVSWRITARNVLAPACVRPQVLPFPANTHTHTHKEGLGINA
jgi:hypothetical protein